MNRKRWIIASAAVSLLSHWNPALAVSSWTFNGTSTWTGASNWLGGNPVAASLVYMRHADATNRTINYDYAGGSIEFDSLRVDNTGAGSSTFVQSANVYNSTLDIFGDSGSGYFSLGAGSHNISAALYLGRLATAKGTGTITGGTLKVGSLEYLGFSGTGTMNQSGGSHSIGTAATPAPLYMGWNAGATGYYSLSGNATLSNIGTIAVGIVGKGTFVQSGGSCNVGTPSAPSNLLLAQGIGNGTYTLSGGTLTTYGTETFGGLGTAIFDQSGGVHNLGSSVSAGTLIISTFKSGTYQLSGNGVFNAFGTEYIGSGGTGSFVQTGGSHFIGTAGVAGTLNIGNGSSAGSYQLSGGTFNIPSGTMFVLGGGTYSQSGGNALVQTVRAGSFGGGDLAISGGTLTATNLYVGTTSQSHAIHNGGTVNPTSLMVGYNSGSSNPGGVYDLSGSAIINAKTEFVGYFGAGTFDQNGGSNNIGTLTSPSYLSIATAANSRGTYNLHAGQLTVYSGEYVGEAGDGTFIQSGGINTILPKSGSSLNYGTLTIGAAAGGRGTYLMSGGTLNLAGEMRIAEDGASGTFLHTGGTVNITRPLPYQGDLTIRNGATPGLYAMSGSAVLNVANIAYVYGAMMQVNGGTLTLPGAVVGSSGVSPGQFVLSAGQMNSTIGHYLGYFGSGTFSHSGGVHIVGTMPGAGDVIVNFAGGPSTYQLSGTGSLLINGNLYVGGDDSRSTGPGTFNMSGGAATIKTAIKVWNQGIFQLSQGVLNAGPINLAGGGKFVVAPSAGQVPVITALSIDTASQFDLADNALVVDYTGTSPIGSIRQLLQAAYANGAWGGNGLTSSTAATAGSGKRFLGYRESLVAGTFKGRSVDATAILVDCTYGGDTNLDGKVDVADLGALASKWQQSGVWVDGDFNYDGAINVADLGLLASNWQAGVSGGGVSFAEAAATLGLPKVSVPEPTVIGLLSAMSLFRRRRSA